MITAIITFKKTNGKNETRVMIARTEKELQQQIERILKRPGYYGFGTQSKTYGQSR